MEGFTITRAINAYSGYRNLPAGQQIGMPFYSNTVMAGTAGNTTFSGYKENGFYMAVTGSALASFHLQTQTFGRFHPSTVSGMDFSAKWRVLIPGISLSAQAETTARIQFRGTSTSTQAAIDGTDWGAEVVWCNGKVTLNARRAAGTALITSGTITCAGAWQSYEVVHDPAVGFSLNAGATPYALAQVASIPAGTSYPMASTTDGRVVIGLARIDGADTSARYFYVAMPWLVYYGG